MRSESDDGARLEEDEIQLELGIRGCDYGHKSKMTASTSECSSSSSSSLLFRRADAAANLNHVHVVGWPPVKRANRTSTMEGVAKQRSIPQFDSVFMTSKTTRTFTSGLLQGISNKDSDAIRSKPHHHMVSPYVKVYMDGYPIGRKVNLTSFDSYDTLARKLEDMFFSSQPTSLIFFDGERNMTRHTEFVLTFEDKEGDWMLVGDVPWRLFCNSVKRLRIMKTSNANIPVMI